MYLQKNKNTCLVSFEPEKLDLIFQLLDIPELRNGFSVVFMAEHQTSLTLAVKSNCYDLVGYMCMHHIMWMARNSFGRIGLILFPLLLF